MERYSDSVGLDQAMAERRGEPPSAAREHPLEGFKPAMARHEPERSYSGDTSGLREAAAEVSSRRRDPIADSVKATDGVDRIRSTDGNGEALEPKASFKQSDLRRVAGGLTDYRQRASAWLRELQVANGKGREASPAHAELGHTLERAMQEFGPDMSEAELDELRVLDPQKHARAVELRAQGQAAWQAAWHASQDPADAEHRAKLADIDASTTAQERSHVAAAQQRRYAEAQAAVELQQAHAAVKTQAQQIGATAQQVHAAVAAEFPELANGVDAQRLAAHLAKTDPPRAARLAAYAQQAQAIVGAVQHLQTYAQQVDAHNMVAQRAQFESYAREQDAKFYEAHPEFKDVAVQMRAAADTAEALRARGYSDADIAALKTNPAARSALGQEALLALARQHVAQKALREHRARELPPVQRPGVARNRGAAAEAELRGLSERLNRTGSIRDAAKLLVAKRRVGR